MSALVFHLSSEKGSSLLRLRCRLPIPALSALIVTVVGVTLLTSEASGHAGVTSFQVSLLLWDRCRLQEVSLNYGLGNGCRY